MKKLFSFILSLNLITSPLAFAEEELYTITGTGSRDGVALYLNSAYVTASGVVGSNLYSCTKGSGMTFSHYIFMGGAITLLMSEIEKASSEKRAIELKQKQIENQVLASQKPGEGLTQAQKDNQLQLLLSAKDEEERIRDILKTRMEWMTAVESVYWLAVAGAVTELIMHIFSQYTGYTDDSLSCGTSGMSSGEKIAMNMIIAAYGINLSALATGQWSSVLLQGVQIAAYIKALKNSHSFISKAIKKGTTSSTGRIITFGVFAGYASYVRSGYEKNKKRAEKNIALLNRMINEWRSATIPGSEIDTLADETTGNPNQPTVKPAVISTLAHHSAAAKPTKNCVSAGSTGLNVSSDSCKNTIKFDRSKIKLDSPLLQKMANLSMDMAESTAKGDSTSAKIMADQLNANATSIRKEVSDLIKKADDKLKKAGKSPLNFGNSVKEQIASLDNDLKKMAMDEKLPLNDDTPAAIADEGNSKNNSETAASAPVVEIPLPTASVDKSLGLISGNSEENISGNKDQQPESIENFVLKEEDVLKNSEVSIFKQISNRYFLNLPKILERKKTE